MVKKVGRWNYCFVAQKRRAGCCEGIVLPTALVQIRRSAPYLFVLGKMDFLRTRLLVFALLNVASNELRKEGQIEIQQ